MKTCSKENGAKLQELGVTVESYFVWLTDAIGKTFLRIAESVTCHLGESVVPAWTAGELLEVLKRIDLRICIQNSIEGWLCGANLEDTLAKRVIYLLEHNHATKEEINGN